jgi:O-antigen/teichoic acid export membrane protein
MSKQYFEVMLIFKRLRNNKLLKTGFNYSIISSIRSFVVMGVGILAMLWLAPDEIGLFSSIAIFLAYIPFFQLGIQNGLNVDLPILLGQNNQNRAMELVANAKAIAFFIMLFFLMAGTITTLVLFIIGTDIAYVLGILTISVIAVSETMRIHLIATFRSANAFNKLTKLYIIDIALSLILIFFIYKYHYYGLLIYNGLSAVASAFLMYMYAPYKKIKLKFNKEPIVSLTKKGLILMSFNQLRLAGLTIPKWIILSFGNVTKLGLFSPANAIGGLMTMLPNQIAQFFIPQMGYKFGQTGKAKNLWPYVKKVLILFPLISVPISICIWLVAPWLLETFFPKYIDSLWAMRIMAVGFVFSSSATTLGVLYSIKAYKYAYIYSLVEIAGYFLCPIFFVKFSSFDILTSVALGISCLSVFLYFLNAFLMRKVLFLDKFNGIG